MELLNAPQNTVQPKTALQKTLANITEEACIRLVGPATFGLGKVAAERGDVTFYQFNAENTEITAKVKGGGLSYTCWISQPGKTVRELDLRCACSTGTYCKHVMAALWKVQGQTQHHAETWRDSLENFLSKTTGGEPLALVVDTKATPAEITIRRQGQNGNWVSARASWVDMTSTKWVSVTDGLRSDHLSFIRKLWNQAQRSVTWVNSRSVTLLNLEANAWKLLKQAEKLGIYLFLDDTEHPLELATDEIHLKFDSYTSENGDIELKTVGQYDSEIITYPQIVDSQPALVKYADRMLIPVSEESHQLLDPAKQRRRILIPATDVAEYQTHYLPYLNHLLVANQTLHGPFIKIIADLNGHLIKLSWEVAYGNSEHTLKLSWMNALSARPEDKDIFTQVRDYVTTHTPLEWGLDPHVPETEIGLENFTHLIDLKNKTATECEYLQWELSDAIKQLQVATNPIKISLKPAVKLDVNKPDWFNLEVAIEVNGQAIRVEEVLRALHENRYWVTTENGTWAEINPAQIDHLRAILESVSENPWEHAHISVPRIRLGALSSLEHYAVNTSALGNWISELNELIADTPERGLATPKEVTLRPYQETGVAWMDRVTSRGYGAILADDMGLGKTLQILSVIETKRLHKELKHGVVVAAPTSVIDVWQKEANRFYPSLKVATIRESAKKRSQSLEKLIEIHDVLITSWTLLQMDQEEYRKLTLDGAIFDEAQAIKNPRTAQHKAAKNLQAHWKIASTGTPVENSLADLWAIMRIVNPALLPGYTAFNSEYGKRIEMNGESAAAKRLQALTQPFMKRRTKKLVAPQLPPKIEQTIYVELSAKHRKTYDRYLNQHRKELLALAEDTHSQGFKIITGLNQLRQLALDPQLVEKDKDWPESAKTQALIDLLLPLQAEGKKSLVFSQYTSYLQRIRTALNEAGITTSYLDGGTQKRGEVIENFKHSDTNVFLISLKAGGTGLTLTEAENVFILDPWWNPATENQAIDRAHRIGQENTVNVYRLCSADTIEEKVMALQVHKRQVADAIIGEEVKALSIAELKEILQ
ncbi:SNF2 family N-terminal domain protein [Gleimia coleocanis DSM 15436]|uniref:SNF2 family N-terminal domain protein n=1 Tax=Gleimia coleocanis DSM 15436 TaxID=525245 RepID=C0W0J4_9ACTO|nr:DEAD/DEAH box helicase [Gleimia coleocanis]EEH64053.1 SNF2 family N-terminal domain protein [Gleimia coleocanis DSM 15436]